MSLHRLQRDFAQPKNVIFGEDDRSKSDAITVEDCPESVPRDNNLQVHGDSCFEFILYRQRTYDDAEADCESRGGTLPLVKTQEIHDYLLYQIRNTYLYLGGLEVWIGLHDKGFETKFLWEDGTPLGSFSNWANGQGPSGSHVGQDVQDCVSMRPADHGKWHDHNCNDNPGLYYGTKLLYVCQYQVEGPTTAAPSTTTTATTPTATVIETTSPVTTTVETTIPTTTTIDTTIPPTTTMDTPIPTTTPMDTTTPTTTAMDTTIPTTTTTDTTMPTTTTMDTTIPPTTAAAATTTLPSPDTTPSTETVTSPIPDATTMITAPPTTT